MTRILFLIFSLHLCSFVCAQQDSLTLKFQFSGRTENYMRGSSLDSVKIVLLDEKDSLLQLIYSSSNGKWMLSPIPIRANYKIKFSKIGFCTKFITLELKNVPDTTHSHLQFEADISLLEKWREEYCDDYSILKPFLLQSYIMIIFFMI